MKAVEKLRTWSVDTFWPWYKTHVLKTAGDLMQADKIGVETGMEGLGVEEGTEC